MHFYGACEPQSEVSIALWDDGIALPPLKLTDGSKPKISDVITGFDCPAGGALGLIFAYLEHLKLEAKSMPGIVPNTPENKACFGDHKNKALKNQRFSFSYRAVTQKTIFCLLFVASWFSKHCRLARAQDRCISKSTALVAFNKVAN